MLDFKNFDFENILLTKHTNNKESWVLPISSHIPAKLIYKCNFFQIRSGPLKYQVTSWLEIKRCDARHTGFYTCIAKNRLGEANATALLEVIEGKFL